MGNYRLHTISSICTSPNNHMKKSQSINSISRRSRNQSNFRLQLPGVNLTVRESHEIELSCGIGPSASYPHTHTHMQHAALCGPCMCDEPLPDNKQEGLQERIESQRPSCRPLWGGKDWVPGNAEGLIADLTQVVCGGGWQRCGWFEGSSSEASDPRIWMVFFGVGSD